MTGWLEWDQAVCVDEHVRMDLYREQANLVFVEKPYLEMPKHMKLRVADWLPERVAFQERAAFPAFLSPIVLVSTWTSAFSRNWLRNGII